jgi:predicted enzyme related to lactoylglutathione lyase
MTSMIRGLRTAIYHVPDLAKAKEWYTQVLEQEPYFDQPFYVGYSVGGFELGLLPDGTPGPGGTVAYWGVPDAAAAMKRLEGLGATIREPLQDVGEGIRIGAVADPFGNTFGLIENPNFSIEKVR